MKRGTFLKLLSILPVSTTAMKLNELSKITSAMGPGPKMPVLFLGHGSPMNAIEENEFVKGFRTISSEIEKPKAVLCISAHWETKGTWVTAMENPKTIHDFGGFPQRLFDVQYPAPGSPDLAKQIKDQVDETVGLNYDWGLDHGTWSVVKHMYPNADVPIIQMSLDYNLSPQKHYELAKQLSSLREKGVLIIGSGNMVHNLRMVAWDKIDQPYAFDWAEEANTKMKQYILDGNHHELVNYSKQGKAFQLSIPTPEHYLPLLYSLGLQDKKDAISLFNDKPVAGSLSMTSVKIG